MNTFVLAGDNNIVVAGTDSVSGDTATVVIQQGATVVTTASAPVPANQLTSQSFPVANGTFDVTVTWNGGANFSVFTGVVVPETNGVAPQAGTPEAKALTGSSAPSGPAHKYKRYAPTRTHP